MSKCNQACISCKYYKDGKCKYGPDDVEVNEKDWCKEYERNINQKSNDYG